MIRNQKIFWKKYRKKYNSKDKNNQINKSMLETKLLEATPA